MNHWWRAYNEAVNDPKLQLISDSLFRAWFNLMCIASSNDGALPAVDSLAFTLRMKPEKVAQVLTQLHGVGLLDKKETGFAPHNWNGRQYKSDVSTERVKRFRNGKRNVSETAPEQKQSTEAEQSRTRAALSNEEKVLRTDLMEAFGADRTPNLSKAGEWLSKGYSSTMILEVVRELLARKPDINSLAYFEPKLAERHANQPLSPTERVKIEAAVDMDQTAEFYKKTGVWSRHAGPEPGQTGCKCPPEILEKHGIAPLLRRMDS